jgi:hypothetical protein
VEIALGRSVIESAQSFGKITGAADEKQNALESLFSTEHTASRTWRTEAPFVLTGSGIDDYLRIERLPIYVDGVFVSFVFARENAPANQTGICVGAVELVFVKGRVGVKIDAEWLRRNPKDFLVFQPVEYDGFVFFIDLGLLVIIKPYDHSLDSFLLHASACRHDSSLKFYLTWNSF